MNTTDPVEAAMAKVIQARTHLAVQDILAHRGDTPATRSGATLMRDMLGNQGGHSPYPHTAGTLYGCLGCEDALCVHGFGPCEGDQWCVSFSHEATPVLHGDYLD